MTFDLYDFGIVTLFKMLHYCRLLIIIIDLQPTLVFIMTQCTYIAIHCMPAHSKMKEHTCSIGADGGLVCQYTEYSKVSVN